MTSQKGREKIKKIGDGEPSETFTALGAARTNSMRVNNNPVDNTAMDSDGVQSMIGDAGVQTLELTIDGLFKDAASEETLRDAAFTGATVNYQLAFPNGDVMQAPFVIREYSRGGTYDGLETFSAVLLRSGAGTFTSA